MRLYDRAVYHESSTMPISTPVSTARWVGSLRQLDRVSHKGGLSFWLVRDGLDSGLWDSDVAGRPIRGCNELALDPASLIYVGCAQVKKMSHRCEPMC